MDKILRLLKRHRGRVLDLPNVVGVGHGQKMVRGQDTGQTAIVVLVREKVPPGKLGRGEIVPKKLDEVETDVIEVGDITLLGTERTGFHRPAHPGMSIAHFRSTAGTFGAVVRDKRTGEPYILSNNHVLANTSDGRDGLAKTGDPILQPGPFDGGKRDHVIGYLERFIPLAKQYATADCRIARGVSRTVNTIIQAVHPGYRVYFEKENRRGNTIDAALAKPVSPQVISPEILEVGMVKGIREPAVGLEVKKSGRSSGLNYSRIKVINASIQVKLSKNETGLFIDQFVTGPMARPGDSGSLILDRENYAVGLLFAGSDSATIGNRIQNVLDTLQVTF